MTAFATEDENLAAERIGANHLLHLGRQTIEDLTGRNIRSPRWLVHAPH
jgi:hypothetical protein